MALFSPTRVQEACTVTGTGNVTLTGAATGSRTFASALSVGASVEYVIAAVDGSGNDTGEYEFGVGTLTGTTTLQRTAPLGGSAATPVNFAAGAKRVFVASLGTDAGLQSQWFGDGSDGDVTVTTAITLTRDVYYNNLTMGASGVINTAGWRVHVAGVLLDTGNVAGAIRNDGAAGTVGDAVTGGAGGAAIGFGSLGRGGAGTSGGNGATGAGAQAGATSSSNNAGGASGASGKGGTSGGNAGGASRTAAALSSATPVKFLASYLMFGSGNVIQGGVPSPGGGGGAGDGSNSGTGGGGGAAAAAVIWLAARVISTTGSTPAGWIRANGGAGADGRQTAPSGNASGGGGGAGGGGGWVYLIYQARVGAAVTGLIAVDGGPGGNGGPGAGTGKGGDGGQGGACGRVQVFDLMTGGTEPVTPGTAGTTPTAATTTAGTAGTAGVTGRATL